MSVTFEPLNPSHRALLHDWTNQPHVKKWWSGAAESLDSFFVAEDDYAPFIAFVNDQAAAYIQWWMPTKNPNYPWQHNMSPTTRGIDLFIGPPELLARGYGPLIVKHFAAKLFAEGATRLIIDPAKANTRAVKAYMKAGFTPFDEYEDLLLMELLPEDCVWLANV